MIQAPAQLPLVTPQPPARHWPDRLGLPARQPASHDSDDSAANDTKIVMWGCDGTAAADAGPSGPTARSASTASAWTSTATRRPTGPRSNCGPALAAPTSNGRHADGTLVNPVSGKCLDDPRFNTADGTQLEIYT